jgi:hypothetical protein
MVQPPDKLKALHILTQEICDQHRRMEALIQQFRQRIEQVGADQDCVSSRGARGYWRLVAYVDSLVRLRLFLENNFNYIETIGILCVARYLFELTVWLKLLMTDSRYGLVYYRELLRKQLDFYTEFRNNAFERLLSSARLRHWSGV